MSRATQVTIGKSIRQGETLAQFMQRVRNGGARKPLRTLREMADEIGIPYKALQGMVNRRKDAPKPIYATGGNGSSTPRNTWYDPDEFRKWWAQTGI